MMRLMKTRQTGTGRLLSRAENPLYKEARTGFVRLCIRYADTPGTKTPIALSIGGEDTCEAKEGGTLCKPTYVVEADKLLSSHPKELWAYRELFLLLVKRDFVAAYKQTVLGPLWFFVQPFLASLVFMVVFGQIARLPTTELPPLVFYMSGIIAWNFFPTV